MLLAFDSAVCQKAFFIFHTDVFCMFYAGTINRVVDKEKRYKGISEKYISGGRRMFCCFSLFLFKLFKEDVAK